MTPGGTIYSSRGGRRGLAAPLPLPPLAEGPCAGRDGGWAVLQAEAADDFW